MENNSRIKMVKTNSIVTLSCQVLQIALGFLVRKIFIESLGVEYLGYNSVFLNILQMLNLADLGISVAITSYLYKPLADNDTKRVVAIMNIYKKTYSVMGIVVLAVGLIASIFLRQLVPDATCSIWYLRILFYINLIGTVSSYFLAYKRTLLIADQKSYLTNMVDAFVYFVISGLQLVLLLHLPNYIIYLLLNIGKNIISNGIISIKANQEYKYINSTVDERLISEYKPKIFSYIKDVFISRIGAVIYYSTDNIILSVIKGSLLTGYLSNYTMITGQLNTVVSQVLSSVQSTYGNYITTTKDNTLKMRMTDNYLCVNYYIGNFCFICFALLAQPFVKLFFGADMLLPFSTAIWLGVNLMLTFLIQLPSQVFVIYKLFNYDRPIILIAALLNIIISVGLVKVIGINGVLIGTFVTSLIYLFSRLYIISKHVFGIKYLHYVKKIVIYLLFSIGSFIITYLAVYNVEGNGLIYFAVRAIGVVLLSALMTTFGLCFTKEFEFLKSKLLPETLRKYVNKYVIGLACISVVIICQLLNVLVE